MPLRTGFRVSVQTHQLEISKRVLNDYCTQLSPRVEREIVFEAMAKSYNFEWGFFFFSSSPLLNPLPMRGHNFKEILRNNLRACINNPTTNSSEWRILSNLLTSLSYWAISQANLFSLTPLLNPLPRRGWNLTKRYSSIHYVDWVLNKPFTFIILCSPLIFLLNTSVIESKESSSEDGFAPT